MELEDFERSVDKLRNSPLRTTALLLLALLILVGVTYVTSYVGRKAEGHAEAPVGGDLGPKLDTGSELDTASQEPASTSSTEPLESEQQGEGRRERREEPLQQPEEAKASVPKKPVYTSIPEAKDVELAKMYSHLFNRRRTEEQHNLAWEEMYRGSTISIEGEVTGIGRQALSFEGSTQAGGQRFSIHIEATLETPLTNERFLDLELGDWYLVEGVVSEKPAYYNPRTDLPFTPGTTRLRFKATRITKIIDPDDR